jgi:carbon starvation protein
MKSPWAFLGWLVVAAIGAFAWFTLATQRGEPVSSAYVLIAAVCAYAIGYRFYSKWIAARALALDDRRATPCEVHEDGREFVKTNRWIVFGHHFAAISGPGPLVGPVLAAQFGYLPGTLWILIGVVLGGAVQDFVILFASVRRDGRSLGQMVKDELNSFAGALAIMAILAIMVILLAVLGLVVVQVLAESPWGVFTVGATIPIALFMGVYLRFVRAGRTLEGSVLGVVLLLLAVWGGQKVQANPEWARALTLGKEPLAWSIIVYGFAASVLPVWLLLAPRDYLSTFMKLGTILALAGGVLLVLPRLRMPAVTPFIDGSGLVVAGKLFPFCFITIACGAISGFHSLVSSGITPKIVTRESYVRPVGYGAMCLESLVAIMALIAACTLDPGVYLAMNVKGAGADAAAVAADTVARIQATGFRVDPAEMTRLAASVGEQSLWGRTGGAATLAVGMANIFSNVTGGRWLDLWYHFAIMFEALFILTTLDAGTRVGRYLLQDALGHLWKPLGNVRSATAGALASALIVAGWGWFLVQGVRDPLGGINSLWPLFGIANQLLAAIALVLGTTVLLKLALRRRRESGAEPGNRGGTSPALALVTLVPLIWLLSVTFTAGVQKIFHPAPHIGFLAAMKDHDAKLPALNEALARATTPDEVKARRSAVTRNRTLRFNQALDAVVTGVFLALAGMVVLTATVVWWCLWRGNRAPELSETPPVWLPEWAIREQPRRSDLAGVVALGLALLREWSGQSDVERARADAARCSAGPRVVIALPEVERSVAKERDALGYAAAAERRFDGINRCC